MWNKCMNYIYKAFESFMFGEEIDYIFRLFEIENECDILLYL